MRITLRLIVSLVVVVASVALFSAYLHVGLERTRQQEELARRSRLLAESLQEAVEPLLPRGASTGLTRLVEKFGNRERLAGVAVYDANGRPLAATASLLPILQQAPEEVLDFLKAARDGGEFSH